MTLKPCPFCNSQMSVGSRSFGWFGHQLPLTAKSIKCPIARDTFPPCDTEAWNTRTPSTDEAKP